MDSRRFPRTYHLPWSPAALSKQLGDDKVMVDVSSLLSKYLLITKKMDGECQRWTRQTFNLRSPDSRGGTLRSRAKAKWGAIRNELLEDCSYFVEDITNEHSIKYPEDISRFYLIAVRDNVRNQFFGWDETVAAADEMGIPTVPLLERGFYIEEELEEMTDIYGYEPGHEGVVVRPSCYFNNWTESAAKWVRANHVTTDEHWERNALRRLNGAT